MIKLKHILKEVIENNSIQSVVDRVYPQIVKDLGGQMKPVEVHENIWKQVDAVGFEDLIRDHTNSNGKYIWRKRIEKARKFIMDSFDEALNEYKKQIICLE